MGDFLEVVEFPGVGGGAIFGDFVGAQKNILGIFGDAEAMGLDGARGAVIDKGDDGARGDGADDGGFCGRGEGRGVCRRRRRQNRSRNHKTHQTHEKRKEETGHFNFSLTILIKAF